MSIGFLLSLCLSPPGNPASRWSGDFRWKSVSLKLANKQTIFFGMFGPFLCFKQKTWVLGSLQTNLLCIVGELLGGGSGDVAVGVSDG